MLFRATCLEITSSCPHLSSLHRNASSSNILTGHDLVHPITSPLLPIGSLGRVLAAVYMDSVQDVGKLCRSRADCTIHSLYIRARDLSCIS